MTDLTALLNETLGQELIEHHVTLLNGEPCPISIDDPASIVSGLSSVRFDAGREKFQGRRRRLTIKRGSHRTTLLARSRPLPDEPQCGWVLVQWARDRRGRPVPVCAVERDTGKIHVLLELETATVPDAAEEPEAVSLLGETFIGDPLSILLSHAPKPRVGADVRRHFRTLLEHRPRGERGALQNELTVLRRFARRSPLPSALARRLDALAHMLGQRRTRVDEERVEREVGRLVKLVASRALGAIRVGPDRIEGLINPGALGNDWRLRPAMFRLQLGYSPLHPILQTWSPLRPAPRRGHGHCLGEALPVLHDLEVEGDVFSLVDTVINFRETNHIRAIPAIEPQPRRRRRIDPVASRLLRGNHGRVPSSA
jgi:hypothetical protein